MGYPSSIDNTKTPSKYNNDLPKFFKEALQCDRIICINNYVKYFTNVMS